MALKNREQNAQFLKLKDGKFYLSSDKNLENAFDQLEGKITNMYFKDEEYEGITNRKLYITVSDGVEAYTFGLVFESLQCTILINFLLSADLTRPITLSPSYKIVNVNGKDVANRTIFVSQDNKSLKSKYAKDELPEIKTIMVNKKPVADKTELLEFFEKMVENKLKPQFQQVITNSQTEVDQDEPWKQELSKEDDIPF